MLILSSSVTLVPFTSSGATELELKMEINKSSIVIGEDINITLSLINAGNQAVTINFTPPFFDVICYPPEGYYYKWSDDQYFVQELLSLTLNPGENYSETLEWNLYRYENGEYYPPKPGTYQLYGLSAPVGLMCGPINVTVKSAQNLRLRTDKHVYLLGENVTIILENIGNSTADVGGYPAWQILTYPEEKPVFPEVYTFLAWNLEPGQSDVFIWNQYDEFNDKFVEPGTYIIKDTQGWNIYTTFIVADPLVRDGASGGKPPLCR
ncbi:hypothetical protein J7K06_03710 [Candidatus Bathyarchaeota archaeon]|nr:hypothetical protein [Candidatus Bathyarchaeota archaeon]